MSVPAVIEHDNLPAVRTELSVEELSAQVQLIQRAMETVMHEETKDKPGHYGVIPGTQKPTLLKPGAEKLCLLFRLDPEYDSVERYDGDHLTVKSKCTLYHIPTGDRIGSGEGSCSTRESKYAYRHGKKVCPDCGQAALVRSTKKSAYFCIGDMGGCGKRYAFSSKQAKAIDDQPSGRVANPDLPDQWNTVLKMANKRALIAAVLNATAASDIFTQDLEDSPEVKVDAPPHTADEPTSKQPEEPSPEPDRSTEDKPAAKGDESITPKQRRYLFALKNEKGLTDDEFKLLLAEKAEKESTKDLTQSDLDLIVAWLSGYEPEKKED